MIKKIINISLENYSSIDELNSEDKKLAEAAIEAMKGAYAPYSHFHVGAAVRMSNGEIVTGANQENAAFPSGLCAERTAMFAASAKYPDAAMRSIAIAGGINGTIQKEPVSPCGACRQVMAQYQTKAKAPVTVIMIGAEGILKASKVDDILPLIFDGI